MFIKLKLDSDEYIRLNVEHIKSYKTSPNGKAVITMINGATVNVQELVEDIDRLLIEGYYTVKS